MAIRCGRTSSTRTCSADRLGLSRIGTGPPLVFDETRRYFTREGNTGKWRIRFFRRTHCDRGHDLNQSDPTDNALAAIASILDEAHAPAEHAPAELVHDKVPAEEVPVVPPPVEANGYSKVGPGPMAAIRFKWMVREADGQYYVDETIGENSMPVVSGPMDADAAIKFVDERERQARQRFEDLQHEMTGRTATPHLTRRDNGGF
jgi:hypothetical protein